MTTHYCEMCDLWMKTKDTACPECGYPLIAAKRRGDRLAIVRTILVALPIGVALWVGIFRCGAAVLHAQSGPQTALVIGSSLDTSASLYKLTTNPRAYETNPFLKHGGTAGFLIGKVVTTAGLTWAIGRIAPKHPTVAKVIGYGGGIALSGLAARNVTVRR